MLKNLMTSDLDDSALEEVLLHDCAIFICLKPLKLLRVVFESVARDSKPAESKHGEVYVSYSLANNAEARPGTEWKLLFNGARRDLCPGLETNGFACYSCAFRAAVCVRSGLESKTDLLIQFAIDSALACV